MPEEASPRPDLLPRLGAFARLLHDAGLVSATMGAALKYQEDLERVREQVPALVERAQRA